MVNLLHLSYERFSFVIKSVGRRLLSPIVQAQGTNNNLIIYYFLSDMLVEMSQIVGNLCLYVCVFLKSLSRDMNATVTQEVCE